MVSTEEEFKRLCDKHSLTTVCSYCDGGAGRFTCLACNGQSEIYPTLSELLDMVEEKYNPDYVLFTRDDNEHTVIITNNIIVAKPPLALGVGETRRLAVLKALIGVR